MTRGTESSLDSCGGTWMNRSAESTNLAVRTTIYDETVIQSSMRKTSSSSNSPGRSRKLKIWSGS